MAEGNAEGTVNLSIDLEDPRALITKFVSRHREVPELQFICEDPEGTDIIQVKGGYCNFSYRLRSKCGKNSVFMKHGTEHVKVDPGQPMPLERRQIEYETLKLIHALEPGACPVPYCLDMDLNIVVMEDLSHMKSFFDLTREGAVDMEGVRRLSKILANLHKSTLRPFVTADRWAELTKVFHRPKVSSTILNFYLVKGLDPDDPTVETFEEMGPAMREFFADEALVQKARSLRSKADEQECLIHADCHMLSVFMGPGRVAVYDLEFSSLSQRSLNIAIAMAWFIIMTYALENRPNKDEIRLKFRNAAAEFWTIYIEEMPDLKEDAARRKFVSELAGYLSITAMRIANCFGVGPIFKATHKQRARVIKHCTRALRIHDKLKSVDMLADFFFTGE